VATLDWVLLGALLLSLLLGAWRGLVVEVLSWVSWVAAFVLAQWWAPAVATQLPMTGASEAIRYAAGFVAVFIAVLLTGSLVAWLAKKLLAAVGLGLVDRLLGALFGVLRGVVIVLAVAVVVHMTPLRSAGMVTESHGLHAAGKVLAAMKPLLPQEFGKYLPH